jgi:hypothetical protein
MINTNKLSEAIYNKIKEEKKFKLFCKHCDDMVDYTGEGKDAKCVNCGKLINKQLKKEDANAQESKTVEKDGWDEKTVAKEVIDSVNYFDTEGTHTAVKAVWLANEAVWEVTFKQGFKKKFVYDSKNGAELVESKVKNTVK